MHLHELWSLPFAVPITFLLLFVPCIGFQFPNASHSRLPLSLSKHYKIIILPIFGIFSFPTVLLILFALQNSISSPYLSSNLPKLVDLSSLLLQLSGILFLSLSVFLPPVHRFIQLLRLIFSPLRSSSSSIGILNFDPAPCMSLLWVMVWAFCVAGIVGLFLCRASQTSSLDGETDVKPSFFFLSVIIHPRHYSPLLLFSLVIIHPRHYSPYHYSLLIHSCHYSPMPLFTVASQTLMNYLNYFANNSIQCSTHKIQATI